MPRVSAERLAELAALAEAATPGPWETTEPGVGGPKLYVDQDSVAYPMMTARPVCATSRSGLGFGLAFASVAPVFLDRPAGDA